MTDELTVHVNREELHALEVPASFEATGSFDVVIVNHGEPLHVHLHLDDSLSRIASLTAGNHHVEGGSERRVSVDVDTATLADRAGSTGRGQAGASSATGLSDDAAGGQLKVSTAYGAETDLVDIAVTAPESTGDTVRVDESLGTPRPAADSGTLRDRPQLLIFALAAGGLFFAVVTGLLVDELLVMFGVILVVFGVLLSVLYYVQSDRF